jgi:hypothetical protein
MCRRAARALDGLLSDKASRRVGPEGLAAMARVAARETALRVATGGLKLVAGAAGIAELDRLEAAAGYPAIRRAQSGLLGDMDLIADVLYGRST